MILQAIIGFMAIERRSLLIAAMGAPLFGFGKNDFWNAKPFNKWSDEEIQRMLTDSPWSREDLVQIDPASLKNGIAPMNNAAPKGPSETSNRRDGPPRDVLANLKDQPKMKAIIRWESAAPMCLAMSKPANEADYVISVSGFPLLPATTRRPGQPAELTVDSELLQEESSLVVKGGQRLHPFEVKLRRLSGAANLVFYFHRAELAIGNDDKEIIFSMKLNGLQLKTRFNAREMSYQGKLAI